ncbi:MAG: polyprenyl diphosphate synthase [bacterium]|nr:polyprenyl diphosphate synthase [bacterium]
MKKDEQKKVNSSQVPKHIGIIMDGNRRWARSKGFEDVEGHEAGVQALYKIVDHCLAIGVKTLTVYALSTENWRERAKKEVKGIFRLLVRLVKDKKEEYKEKGIRLAILGDYHAFPRNVGMAIDEILRVVKDSERLKVNVALNYGGRDEIIKAIKRLISDKMPPDRITEETFSKFLFTNGTPDPDLIIRTGGEVRLSNFLIWQMSYSELYFTDVLWPDFSPQELDKAIAEFQRRERRFGK